MKKILLIVTTISLFLSLSLKVEAEANSPLIINELMPNPDGLDSKYEWIEIYNTSNSEINTLNWSLDGEMLEEYIVPPRSFLIITRSKNDFIQRYGDEFNIIEHNFSLSNNADQVSLSNNSFLDSISYEDSKTEMSFERHCKEQVFSINDDGHSIGKVNNICTKDKIMLNRGDEWTDNLSAFKDETIRLKTVEDFHHFTWSVENSTSTGKVLELNLSEYKNDEINIQVEVTSDEQTIQFIDQIKIYPKVRFNEIFANPSGKDEGSEWVEFINPNKEVLKNWKLTDKTGEESFDIDSVYYYQFYPSSITLNNSEESLKLYTPTGLLSDSITFEDITEEISLSLIQGNWQESLKPTPGSENIYLQETVEASKEDVNNPDYDLIEYKPSPKIIIDYPKQKIDYVKPNLEFDNNTKKEKNLDKLIGSVMLILSGGTGFITKAMFKI